MESSHQDGSTGIVVGGCRLGTDVCNSIMSADVAFAPNKNEVQIHQFAAGKWKPLETLSEHGQRVTGIDWAPTSNRIVTCGAVSYLEYSTLCTSTVTEMCIYTTM